MNQESARILLSPGDLTGILLIDIGEVIMVFSKMWTA